MITKNNNDNNNDNDKDNNIDNNDKNGNNIIYISFVVSLLQPYGISSVLAMDRRR